METNNGIKKKKKWLLPLLIAIGVVVFFVAIMSAIVITIIATAVAKESNYNKKLEMGSKYLTELDYDSAIAFYEEAIAIKPKKEKGYLGIADVYIARAEEYENYGMYDLAQNDYQNAINWLSEGDGLIDSNEIDSYLNKVYSLQSQLQNLTISEIESVSNNDNTEHDENSVDDEWFEIESKMRRILDDSSIFVGGKKDIILGDKSVYDYTYEEFVSYLGGEPYAWEFELSSQKGAASEQNGIHYSYYEKTYSEYIEYEIRTKNSGVNLGYENLKSGDSLEIVLTLVGISDADTMSKLIKENIDTQKMIIINENNASIEIYRTDDFNNYMDSLYELVIQNYAFFFDENMQLMGLRTIFKSDK